MKPARRAFLGFAAAAAAGTMVLHAQQSQPSNPTQRPPLPPAWAGANAPGTGPDAEDLPKLDPSEVQRSKIETAKKDVARLADLAQQLQKEVDGSTAGDTLSLDFLRKSKEIEKLAKQIQGLEKG